MNGETWTSARVCGQGVRLRTSFQVNTTRREPSPVEITHSSLSEEELLPPLSPLLSLSSFKMAQEMKTRGMVRQRTHIGPGSSTGK